ncbi:MAG: hypothetical protein ACE5Q6_11510, partial [Dehalococcoidia bacterium]
MVNKITSQDVGKPIENSIGGADPQNIPLIDDVLSVVREVFPDDSNVSTAVNVCLSAAAALCVKGLEGCPAILLEGRASGRKTTVLRFFPRELEDIVYQTDRFTPASFVSHISGKTEAELDKIDLLPRITHKVFVVLEMRVVLSDSKEKLQENLGVLTRVLDGHGLARDSGVYGQRGYYGDMKFCFLGATTPLTDFAWQEMSNVGSRMLVLDMGGEEPTEDELAQMATDPVPFEDKVERCRQAVYDFLEGLWERTGGYGGIDWDVQSPVEMEIAKQVAKFARLTAKLRGSIIRSAEDGTEGSVQKENPIRLMTVMMSIARGHAIASGRTELVSEDVTAVIDLTLDTCPNRRRMAFRCVLDAEDGTATTRDIEEAASCSKGTALKLMEDLVALGVVQWAKDEESASGFQARQQPKRIKLAGEYDWLRDILSSRKDAPQEKSSTDTALPESNSSVQPSADEVIKERVFAALDVTWKIATQVRMSMEQPRLTIP